MKSPTIKGIFVNSHINSLKAQKGDQGLALLQKEYQKPIVFKNSEDVPISEEIKILEICLDILSPSPVPIGNKAFEAGRLHFKNFITTPFAKIIFSMFRNNFKLTMLQSDKIAGHVFRGIEFSSQDCGPNCVKIVMKNNDYDIDHFKGLFYEWMLYSGLTGNVLTKELTPSTYEYTITWK